MRAEDVQDWGIHQAEMGHRDACGGIVDDDDFGDEAEDTLWDD